MAVIHVILLIAGILRGIPQISAGRAVIHFHPKRVIASVGAIDRGFDPIRSPIGNLIGFGVLGLLFFDFDLDPLGLSLLPAHGGSI